MSATRTDIVFLEREVFEAVMKQLGGLAEFTLKLYGAAGSGDPSEVEGFVQQKLFDARQELCGAAGYRDGAFLADETADVEVDSDFAICDALLEEWVENVRTGSVAT